jgi:LmbE family N-acetylglucosaminyl deacetylase
MGYEKKAGNKPKLKRLTKKFAELWVAQKNKGIFPSFVDCPEGPNVLVLSPHPDDDILGCGGTLVKHKKAGHTITSVTLTDGSLGDPSFPDRASLIQEREKESERAAKIIGISRCVFLREKDQELESKASVIRKIENLLDEIKPDLVYLPFFLDNHPDHVATHKIFYQVAENNPAPNNCCFYETWAPLYPNILVDTSAEMDLKVRAIGEYKTQLKHFDYIRICQGLNAYRSMLFGGQSTYAEAFYLSSVEEYLSLFKVVWGDQKL